MTRSWGGGGKRREDGGEEVVGREEGEGGRGKGGDRGVGRGGVREFNYFPRGEDGSASVGHTADNDRKSFRTLPPLPNPPPPTGRSDFRMPTMEHRPGRHRCLRHRYRYLRYDTCTAAAAATTSAAIPPATPTPPPPPITFCAIPTPPSPLRYHRRRYRLRYCHRASIEFLSSHPPALSPHTADTPGGRQNTALLKYIRVGVRVGGKLRNNEDLMTV